MKMFHTPGGVPVKGILQSMSGVQHATRVNEDGAPDYGETTVYWDEAKDEERLNDETGEFERIWICEDGCEWFESQLVMKEAAR